MPNPRTKRPPEPCDNRKRTVRDDSTSAAIERATAFLRSRQLPTGAWLASECFEPQSSAMHVLTLAFIERLALVEVRAYARFLGSLQRDDGSFPAYPHAEHGDVATSALVLAALEVADLEEQAPVRKAARAFVEENGGLDEVRAELLTHGNVIAIFLAMAGKIDPFTLPDPELSFVLAPPVLDQMLKKMHAGVVQTIIFMGAVTRALRERVRPSPAHLRKMHEFENERCADFLESWLNPNGSNNGVTWCTDVSIAALVALGRSPESTRVHSALCWFNHLRVWDDRGLHLEAFTNENWMTAFAIRALLTAGVRRDDPAIGDALDYLCWSQSKLPMPHANLRRKNAHRAGGWGFQEDNLVLVDTDDTGIVLSALGLALDAKGEVPLGAERRKRVQDAVDLGLQNALDMQNEDGGWAAFVWNLGSKPRGPLFDKAIPMPSTLIERIRLLAEVPLELAEPAVEGLTGRVLQGLAANGFGASSSEVQHAARFLEQRQMPDGSWWARWIVGYIAATASVVSGLARCGWDLRARWVERGIEYLLAKQNEDGGWGETVAAYERPHAGFESPSMPPLTGMVVLALVDAKLHDHPAVERAVAYLTRTQLADGSWPSNGWLQIMLPYSKYYDFEGEGWYRPLEALSAFRRAREAAQGVPKRDAKGTRFDVVRPALTRLRRARGRWDTGELRCLRQVGDSEADRIVEGAGARERLADSLPPWADAERILRGQKLFTRYGWVMVAGFFCSSLPQAYCAANGARVLTLTQGMTRNVRPRILGTAQFVLDVCSEGSFAASAPGIAAAQKVRLIHAGIRRGILAKGAWDTAELGVPINQEDLAGTLMTFSVVLLDALKTAGFDVPGDDEEDFLHLWKVAGHFLGVLPALLPVDVADARAMMQAIRDDQWAPSVQGKLLTKELITSMREYLPGKVFDDVPAVLIRFFAPEPAPKLLGIAETGSFDRLLDAGVKLGSLFGAATREESRRTLIRRLSRDLMVGLVAAQRGAKGPAFRVASSLVRGWELGARP
jgi:squalene cyclase